MVLDPILDQDAFSQQPRTETSCFASRIPQLLHRWCWDLLFSRWGVKYLERRAKTKIRRFPSGPLSRSFKLSKIKHTITKILQIWKKNKTQWSKVVQLNTALIRICYPSGHHGVRGTHTHTHTKVCSVCGWYHESSQVFFFFNCERTCQVFISGHF